MSEILKYGVIAAIKTQYKQREKEFLKKSIDSLNFKRNLRIMFRTKLTSGLFNYNEMSAYNPSKVNYADLLSIMGRNNVGYVNQRRYVKQQTDARPKNIARKKLCEKV